MSAESSHPDELLDAYETLQRLASKLRTNATGKDGEKSNKNAGGRKRESKASREATRSRSSSSMNGRMKKRVNSARGQGETMVILHQLEEELLPGTFFSSKPRTTGETKEKLRETTGRSFTSRKVSQALGLLWKKKELRRTGTRNYYVYSK